MLRRGMLALAMLGFSGIGAQALTIDELVTKAELESAGVDTTAANTGPSLVVSDPTGSRVYVCADGDIYLSVDGGVPTLYADLGEQMVWDLAIDDAEVLYAATTTPPSLAGQVLRIASEGTSETLFGTPISVSQMDFDTANNRLVMASGNFENESGLYGVDPTMTDGTLSSATLIKTVNEIDAELQSQGVNDNLMWNDLLVMQDGTILLSNSASSLFRAQGPGNILAVEATGTQPAYEFETREAILAAMGEPDTKLAGEIYLGKNMFGELILLHSAETAMTDALIPEQVLRRQTNGTFTVVATEADILAVTPEEETDLQPTDLAMNGIATLFMTNYSGHNVIMMDGPELPVTLSEFAVE